VSLTANKALVRRLVEDAVNRQDLDVLDEVAEGEIARAARRWIGPFRESFPDFRMEIVDLIAEDDKVVAHFLCSGTHQGEWQGVPATGRRFERVDEIYIFAVKDGKLAGFTAVEDNLTRLRQLGIEPRAD
jgi:steroid delta-isomerase-like uncharacterized protein